MIMLLHIGETQMNSSDLHLPPKKPLFLISGLLFLTHLSASLLSHIGIISLIHNFRRNIVIAVVTHNSTELKLFISDKINKGFAEVWYDLSNNIVKSNEKEVWLENDTAVFEINKTLSLGSGAF